MTENQFKIEFDGHRYFHVNDEVNERCLARLDTMSDARAWLEIYEMLSDENNKLKNELARQQLINTSMKTGKGIDKLQSKIKELIDENEHLREIMGIMPNDNVEDIVNVLNYQESDKRKFQKENEQLKQQKRFLKIHDEFYIQYGDDRELFDLHKPADIRSLCVILNREHGFSELQCEYNDEEHRE